MLPNGIIFGCYAAHIWTKTEETIYNTIDILDIGKKLPISSYNVDYKDEYATYITHSNMHIKLHHKQPELPIINTVLFHGLTLETKEDTKTRLKYDLTRYSKLVSFWKDYYPEKSDIVHLSFEMESIRQYLKYL